MRNGKFVLLIVAALALIALTGCTISVIAPGATPAPGVPQPPMEQPPPGQPPPGEPQPGQPPPGEPQPGQPPPGEPQPGQPPPGEPQPGQPPPGEPQPGQPPPGEPQPGQPQQPGCAGPPTFASPFTANPNTITAGQTSMLSWGNITNGTTGPMVRSAVIEPGLGEVGSGASSRPVTPNTTTTYTLTATGCGGTVTRQVTVTVNPAGGGQPPGGGGQPGAGCAGAPNIPFFTANPSTITAGQSSTLSWGNITNGTTGPLVRSAVIEPGLGEVGSGASSRQVKPNTTTTYTLTATGCGGTVTRQVTVTVGSGGGGAGTTTADLAITDIYTDSQWKLYVKIRNNGPGQLTNAVAKLTCSVGVTPPGGIPSKTGSSGPITLNLNSGQETAIATGGTLNTVAWYDVTCSIQAQTFNDSNSANNSLQKKITHGP